MPEVLAALVTGASRGIGRAIALQLGSLGYRVGVNYAHSDQAAAETVGAIEAEGGQALAIQGDVGREADRTRLLDELLGQFGRIDVLVNNAGITSPGRKDLIEVDPESWDRVFDTNLKGPFFLSQAVAREMIRATESGQPAGTIVNISSVSAYTISVNRVEYCLTKAALAMMTKLLAARLADEGINVFEICPGIITSDMTAPVREKYDDMIADGLAPMRRWGTPDDVARAVAAVVSGHFPFSTGERINVDGGYHIRRL